LQRRRDRPADRVLIGSGGSISPSWPRGAQGCPTKGAPARAVVRARIGPSAPSVRSQLCFKGKNRLFCAKRHLRQVPGRIYRRKQNKKKKKKAKGSTCVNIAITNRKSGWPATNRPRVFEGLMRGKPERRHGRRSRNNLERAGGGPADPGPMCRRDDDLILRAGGGTFLPRPSQQCNARESAAEPLQRRRRP